MNAKRTFSIKSFLHFLAFQEFYNLQELGRQKLNNA